MWLHVSISIINIHSPKSFKGYNINKMAKSTKWQINEMAVGCSEQADVMNKDITTEEVLYCYVLLRSDYTNKQIFSRFVFDH